MFYYSILIHSTAEESFERTILEIKTAEANNLKEAILKVRLYDYIPFKI